MIIDSVIPIERIFENMENMECNYQETEVDGIQMVVEPTDRPYEAKIVRLLSPNPQDYLNPRFMPGQTIHFRPNSGIF
jgi:hypothetical protein